MAGRTVLRRLRLATLVVSPLLFFLLLELALRAAGFGSSYPLFVEAESAPGYLQTNPRVIQRYFPGQAAKLGIDPIPFLAHKPPDVYRIVVQGGSSAAGFPYGRWAGLAGMLGDRLEAAFPEREIEVITTAMAGANSYILLDFVDEILEIEPDAVLVYAGHNEYLGLFGVGSGLTGARSRTATRVHLALARLRVSQLAQQLLTALRGLGQSERPPRARARATMMARAAAGAQIPIGSPTHQAGLRQLEANLGRILQRYREAGVPVYVGTLASNEKDQPPFASEIPERVDKEHWEDLWQGYQHQRRVGDRGSARAALFALLDLDPDSAMAWYALGRLEHAEGEAGAARHAFRNAKDRDELPFRAPESFNQQIRDLASREQATVVEVQSHLTAESAEDVLGADLFLDHLHPNAEGYFLLADAYWDALQQEGVFGDGPPARSRDQAMQDMPITVLDRILAEQAIRELKGDFPFTKKRHVIRFPTPTNEIERLARQLHSGEIGWLGAMEALLQLYLERQEVEEAALVARIAAQAFPTEYAPNFSAGKLLLQQKRFARARRYLERSLAANPAHVQTLAALVTANLGLDDVPQTRRYLNRLKQLAPEHRLVKRAEEHRAARGRAQSSPASPRPEP
jgi:lysophospholipase L1-like esterase